MHRLAFYPQPWSLPVRVRTFWAVITGLALVLTLAIAPAQAEEPARAVTGLTEQQAAGSCWEVKENEPSAADGIYWLLTPALKAPQQFYCDMTTAGGGWVLLGRGREGWQSTYQGVGTAEAVRNTVTGPSAFTPAQLDSRVVDGLLNGERVDALVDGVRVRRALNAQGSQWQEVRFSFQSRDRWVWTFGADHRVRTYQFDGASGSGGMTHSFGNNNGVRRVDTSRNAQQAWLWGWAYGGDIRGTNSPSSYLWSNTNNGGNARPFAQVFVRPKLRLADLDFQAISDAGAPKEEQRVLHSNYAAPTVWGVSGLANGSGGEHNTEAQAFAQVGRTVYVGGNFKFVQRNRAGSDQVQQSYLAAFDVDSGQWISTFRPQLNGQVRELVALADGRLAVGGQFSSVNGTQQLALAFLDPGSGSLSGEQISIENRTSAGVVQVRGLAVHENLLYVAGAFTHLTGSNYTASAWNGARIDTNAGRPDGNWNPLLNGTSVGVDASARGDRTYFSGFFKTAKGASQPSAAALQTSAGANVDTPAWTPVFSRDLLGNVWQLTVREEGNKVWLGGSEHSLFSYDRDTFELTDTNITYFNGDFQTSTSANGVVYAGCHCGDWQYQGASVWPDVGSSWTQADKIDTIGAWDNATGDYLPDWAPYIKPRAGYGAWGVFADSNGTLWVGGDTDTTARGDRSYQWSGGFARFLLRDSSAPSTPSNLAGAVAQPGRATLSWGASTDDSGRVSYEVLVDDKVVRTVTATTAEIELADEARVFVRAVDPSGNRSATTPVLRMSTAPDDSILVPLGSAWRWRYDSAALPSDWASRAFDDSGWHEGDALLAMNVPGQATDISPGGTNPLSAQFRRSFEVDDLNDVGGTVIRVIANDAVVVYVNGTEVGRSNLPNGALTQNSYALSSPRHSTASANMAVFEVPRAVLRNGVNVIAASTHLGYRATPDVSFDLELQAVPGDPLPAAPLAANLSASPSGAGVALAWEQPGDAEIEEYVLTRDEVELARVEGSVFGYEDSTAQAGETHVYAVAGIDMFGQRAPWVTVEVSVPEAEPEPVLLDVVAADAVWKWQYVPDAWLPQWQEAAFDDAGWKSGPAPLGFGSNVITTDISVGAPATRPISAQFRHGFDLVSLSGVQSAALSLVADDGAVIHLNGVELGRVRMPAGALNANSYPTASISTSSAFANQTVFEVPLELLHEGTNTLAASMHLGWRTTPNVSFAATLTLEVLES